MTVIFLLSNLLVYNSGMLASKRNFFGIIKVFEGKTMMGGEKVIVRNMAHGTTVHGFQVIEPKNLQTEPTSYFSRKSPLGDVFDIYKPRSVGVIGLGAGIINCHAAPDRIFTFIEIDPEVVETAQREFTFLSDCISKAPPQLIVGDGRLELEKLKETYDLFILDAFSSDVIPTHLLTDSALKLYFDHVGENGVVVLHISNRHFHLEPAIAATADMLGYKSRFIYRDKKEVEDYGAASMWVALARSDEALKPLDARKWEQINRRPGMKPWTDDYTNLLSTLKYLH